MSGVASSILFVTIEAMLNPFPDLLAFALIVPTFFRLILSLIFIRSSLIILLNKENKEKEYFFDDLGLVPGNFYAYILALIEFIGGVALLLGYRTQIAALVLGIIVFIAFIFKLGNPHALRSGTRHYLLLFAMTISLLFLGPGFFAFDLPL